MRRAVGSLCVLLLTCSLAGAGLFARDSVQAAHSAPSAGGDQAAQGAACLNQGRHRPLFARRGQYQRQSVPRPRAVPVHTPHPPPPPKVTPKPVKLKCSHLTQSCAPQSGCCESYTTCHCRFFNAICFCRRAN